MDGKISKGYKELLLENVPEQAPRSRELLGQIRSLAEQTRQQLQKP